MQHLFSLNAEGGPLLCLDARAASDWRGANDGAADYDELCMELDSRLEFSASILSLRGNPGVVWEMQGAGTADVFIGADDSLWVLRAWSSGNAAQELGHLAAAAPSWTSDLGELEVPSGAIALFWAAESGRGVHSDLDEPWRPIAGTSIDGSGFIVKVHHRRYRCADERVQVGESHGRLLRLTPA